MRRLLILPVLVLTCALSLVACGSSSGADSKTTSSSSTSSSASSATSTASSTATSTASSTATSTAKALAGLAAVTITGSVGSAPTVSWKGPMSAATTESKTLVAGTGAKIASGDSVLAQVYVGDGATQKQAISTYSTPPAQVFTDDAQLPAFLKPIAGATIGSRIAITSTADTAFGSSGSSSLGVGDQDPVLVIIDLVSPVLKTASGTHAAYPAWAPHPTTAKGLITGFDFTGVPAPTGALRSVTIAKGDGAVVKSGQTIVVHYLGEVFGGAKAFDQNFDSDPTSFVIGAGQVIKGWDQTLVGQTVGSRVLMEVPPALGYGSQGNSQAGISGTDTLVFVVDILGAG